MSARAEDSRPLRRKAVGPTKAVPLSRIGLAPEQVAFIGEAAAENVFVQVLCWPTMPAAWSALAEAAASMRAIRDGLSMSNPVVGSSWLQQVAPQLSGPLEREWGAAESTLATLIRRLPVRFAVAIVRLESGERQGGAAARCRSLFTGCLTAYGTYLKTSNQCAFRLMLAPGQSAETNAQRLAVYAEMLPHLEGSGRLGALELAFWPGGTPPLPMEVAQLAAAAVSRHLQAPAQANPLFDAVREQLAPPSHFHALSGRSARR
ncbi:hypothetical protein EAH88_14925 [Rhodanobacter glycinis]|uniref:Uncharacterized protein n=1 Tax=Rhodanobacter glycinis TaxID=582702 RepID=A0A502C1X9_9GAMM|nr:hypothetical protein EAH88_14925 [Rhodanobacter glycinis]